MIKQFDLFDIVLYKCKFTDKMRYLVNFWNIVTINKKKTIIIIHLKLMILC